MSTLLALTVTGICQDASGNAYAELPVYFKAGEVFGADGVVVSTDAIKVLTDEDGAFSAEILTVDAADAFVRYTVILPSGDEFTIDVDADSPTSLDELIDQESRGTTTLAARIAAVIDATAVPATASSTGSAGQIAADASYLYICTATNTWKRAALSTW